MVRRKHSSRAAIALFFLCSLSVLVIFVLTGLAIPQASVPDEFQKLIEEYNKKEKEKYQKERQQRHQQELFTSGIETVVVVKGRLNGTPVFGAGIVVGRGPEGLYIVTANHVLRRGTSVIADPIVVLKTDERKTYRARLQLQFDADVDLAVLLVPDVASEAYDVCKHLSVLIRPHDDSIERGTKVVPVGHPNGQLWIAPVVPDAIVRLEPDAIIFQSNAVAPGSSGGGLFTENGSLLGMIINDAPPFSMALKTDRIVSKLRGWNIPTQLQVGYREVPIDWVSGSSFPIPPECRK